MPKLYLTCRLYNSAKLAVIGNNKPDALQILRECAMVFCVVKTTDEAVLILAKQNSSLWVVLYFS